MAYCFYNGVKLPELPSSMLENYPYCWIRKNDNTQHYDLIFTKVLGYYDASAGGVVYGENSATAEIAHYRVAYADANTADSWSNYQTTNTWMALDANRTVMWSNHYIPNGSRFATEMYFDGYEAIPDVEAYQIEKDTVVGIADQVRRLCKTEATMTPAQMESNLGSLNIELMDLYVTSTTQDVTYTPEEGYYGFSKVVVGGVDPGGGSGGSGGGGGSGDDSGDEPFIPPSAADVSFGYELVDGDGEETVPSGYLINPEVIGTCLERFKAYPVVYPYHYLDSNGGVIDLWQTELPMLVKDGHYDIVHNAEGKYVRYSYTYSDETWVLLESSVSDNPFDRTSISDWVWFNHDIYRQSGTLGSPACEPLIVETVPAKVEKPVEVEEEYTVSGESINDLISITQKITGGTGPMTFEEATNALTDYGVRPSAEEESF